MSTFEDMRIASDQVEGDLRHTLMPFGFEHGDGWFDLVRRQRKRLEPPPLRGNTIYILCAIAYYGHLPRK